MREGDGNRLVKIKSVARSCVSVGQHIRRSLKDLEFDSE